METAHRLSRQAALAVFALAPLPFGSVDRGWILLWTAILSLSLLTADTSGVDAKRLRRIGIGLAAFAAYAGIAILQWTGMAGLQNASIWQDASAVLGESLPPHISSIAASPLQSLAPALLFTLAALRAFVLATEPGGAKLISQTIGRAAVAFALYSAISLILAPDMLLWREKQAYLSNLTGTFINRNTAATYFGSASIIWMLALVHELRMRTSRKLGLRSNFQALLNNPPRDVLAAMAAFLVCFAATAASGSRAGFLLTILMLVLSVALSVDWRAMLRRAGWLRVGVALLLGLGLIEVWGGGVAARIDQRGLADVGRMSVYRTSFDIIADHPIFGIGLGAFESYFPMRRPPELGSAGIWDRAHSTPLEIAVEMGLPAAAILAGVFLLGLAALTRSAIGNRRRAVICGLTVGILGIAHSCVDFSLQIPGYAVVFAALTAAGLASLDLRSRNTRSERTHEERTGRLAAMPSPETR